MRLLECSKWNIFWWIILSGYVASVWALPHFLTQDGSAHLYTASVFLQLLEGGAPVISETYTFNSWHVPTWAGGCFLALLIKLFGVFAGEKILISIIILLTACGFRSVLKVLGARGYCAPFLILPFLFNHILMMGLYYYLLSFALSLYVFAWFYPRLGGITWRDSALLSGCFLFVFYVHPIPPALTGFCIVSFVLLRWMKGKAGGVEFLYTILSGLPCALVGLRYVWGSAYEGGIASGIGLFSALQDIASVSVLVSFQNNPQWWNLICVILMLVITLRVLIALIQQRAFQLPDIWLFFSGLLILLIAWVPEGVTGGTLMSVRLNLVFWVCWIIWLSFRLDMGEVRWLRSSLLSVVVLASVIQASYTMFQLRKVQPVMSAVQSVVESIPDSSFVWALVMNPQGVSDSGRQWAPRNMWLVHTGLRFIAYRKDIAALTAYQGEVGHFMTKFKDSDGLDYFRGRFDEDPSKYVMKGGVNGWILYIGVDTNVAEEQYELVQSRETNFGFVKLFKVK